MILTQNRSICNSTNELEFGSMPCVAWPELGVWLSSPFLTSILASPLQTIDLLHSPFHHISTCILRQTHPIFHQIEVGPIWLWDWLIPMVEVHFLVGHGSGAWIWWLRERPYGSYHVVASVVQVHLICAHTDPSILAFMWSAFGDMLLNYSNAFAPRCRRHWCKRSPLIFFPCNDVGHEPAMQTFQILDWVRFSLYQ